MVKQKKIEIIIETVYLDQIISSIDKLKISGYTVIKDSVIGRGIRGKKFSSELQELLQNSYIMIICSEKEVFLLLEEIQNIIHLSGICFVTDVERFQPLKKHEN